MPLQIVIYELLWCHDIHNRKICLLEITDIDCYKNITLGNKSTLILKAVFQIIKSGIIDSVTERRFFHISDFH